MNKNNFFVASQGFFHECDRPTRQPDFISTNEGNVSSVYWFEDDYLIRQSNHWFTVGYCFWAFVTNNPQLNFLPLQPGLFNSVINGEVVAVTGRVEWDKLYWADKVDPKNLIDKFVNRQGRMYLLDEIISQYYEIKDL